jgi:N-formylglutamate amidohydrolase
MSEAFITASNKSEVLRLLNTNRIIAGQGSLGGFAYTVDPSAPYMAAAIHAGSKVRDALLPLMKISPEERFFEEDPATDTMIQDAASAVWGLDSRSEYDLNRPLSKALPLTPEQFWGTQVYLEQPGQRMNRESLAKYHQFYEFMGSWVRWALATFGVCLVYDVHAYNITRQVQKGISSPPVFNLGTEGIVRRRWSASVEAWLARLKEIEIPSVQTTVAENYVFQGKGELCRRLTQWDPRILVLPTEISKVYMDEITGAINSNTVQALKKGLGKAMQEHSKAFLQLYG